MGAPPRARIIRARQRARPPALLGFERNLRPLPQEWFVDRLNITVTGAWRSVGPGADFWAIAPAEPTTAVWFRNPERHHSSYSITTGEPPRSTLGWVKLNATRVTEREGAFKIDLKCNPSRTLSHLLALRGLECTADNVARLPPDEFFQRAEPEDLQRSLDGGDNWISDIEQARIGFGNEISERFIPIFAQKVREFVWGVLPCPFPDTWQAEGSSDVLRSADGYLRLDWGRVSVPQIEVYFERHHGRAVEAVRNAGMRLLSSDERNTTRRHCDLNLTREFGAVSVTVPLTSTRKLVIYAKTPTRIRFEVRRERRGRYDLPTPTTAMGRLTGIIRRERELAAGACSWPELARQFDEQDLPNIADLVSLIEAVVFSAERADIGLSVLAPLLIDGSIAESAMPAALRIRLVALGILKRVRIRPRGTRNADPRYSLVGHYADLQARMRALLSNPDQGN